MPEILRAPEKGPTIELGSLDRLADRSARQDSFRPIILVWALMLMLRAAALIIGVDRLPLTPTVIDEVIINDPSVALSRGYGLVAFSFEHSKSGLDRIYGHFPPVFIALQALVFRLFGFSVFTLRASSVLFDLATCVIFLAILRELWRRGFAETRIAALAGLLVVLEPTTLIHSRQGRMESLVVFLGGLAFYLAMRAERSVRHERLLWTAGSAAVGVALSTHFAALMMWAAFTLWSIRRLRQVGPAFWLTINSLPIAVLCLVWGVTYRENALAALRQMQLIANYSPGPALQLGGLVSNIVAGNFQAVMNTSGGPALLCTLASLGFALWRMWATRKTTTLEETPDWRSALAGLSAILIAECLLLEFVVPSSGWNRVLMAVPFAFVCVSVAGSNLPHPSGRALAAIGLITVAATQILTISFYMEQLRQDWNARSPDRFESILHSIPDDSRVAAVPQLWYAFLERKQRVALIYPNWDESHYYLDARDAFDAFDFVILNPASPDYPQMLTRARATHPVQVLFKTFKEDFVVFARLRFNPLPPGN